MLNKTAALEQPDFSHLVRALQQLMGLTQEQFASVEREQSKAVPMVACLLFSQGVIKLMRSVGRHDGYNN